MCRDLKMLLVRQYTYECFDKEYIKHVILQKQIYHSKNMEAAQQKHVQTSLPGKLQSSPVLAPTLKHMHDWTCATN
jgi:hypothetical protein